MRIAIHALYDFCLPLQKGEPYTEERIKSNKEIEEVLQEHQCDYEDLLSQAGYFVAEEWEERNGKIWFKNTDENITIVPREWVIFESENPKFFVLMDKPIPPEPSENVGE